jgi:hypothetical protein
MSYIWRLLREKQISYHTLAKYLRFRPTALD